MLRFYDSSKRILLHAVSFCVCTRTEAGVALSVRVLTHKSGPGVKISQQEMRQSVKYKPGEILFTWGSFPNSSEKKLLSEIAWKDVESSLASQFLISAT